MSNDAAGPTLSAIFVDYDNIYLALKRRSDDAAKRFSKDAALWIRELESGRLITATNGHAKGGQRRIVLNRCYGNPMPRRNADSSTDMNSFPFVRHHFLRAGSEVVDCPPLTAQLKNSADIRIVMDVRDMISHDTYFDEFIILSGDADFTPLLHRLRAHARRTVIFANDHTAQPYTAISDGEVRESDLLRLLLEGSLGQAQIAADPDAQAQGQPQALPRPTTGADLAALRRELIGEVITLVRTAGQPVPLEALADRLVRQLGHEKTTGAGWGGSGGFRDLLLSHLPDDFRLSAQAPFVVYEAARMLAPEPGPKAEPQRLERTPPVQRSVLPTVPATHTSAPGPLMSPAAHSPMAPAATARPAAPMPQAAPAPQRAMLPPAAQAAPEKPQPAPVQPAGRAAQPNQAMAIQQAVARIYEACQAPPLSPPEYRAVFDVMANEINTRGLTGAPTLDNIVTAAKGLGVDIRRDDVRFLLDVVSESDPWFEQGASPQLFASRFRNFVVARCRSHGLALSADELDLIEHWFAAPAALSEAQPAPQRALPAAQLQPDAAAQQPLAAAGGGGNWWSMNDQASAQDALSSSPTGGDDFPRIIRSRLRS